MNVDPDFITDEDRFSIGCEESPVSELQERERTTEPPENDTFIMIPESELISV
jgi:hypothetical protein